MASIAILPSLGVVVAGGFNSSELRVFALSTALTPAGTIGSSGTGAVVGAAPQLGDRQFVVAQASDATGRTLLVADSNNNRVLEVDVAGRLLLSVWLDFASTLQPPVGLAASQTYVVVYLDATPSSSPECRVYLARDKTLLRITPQVSLTPPVFARFLQSDDWFYRSQSAQSPTGISGEWTESAWAADTLFSGNAGLGDFQGCISGSSQGLLFLESSLAPFINFYTGGKLAYFEFKEDAALGLFDPSALVLAPGVGVIVGGRTSRRLQTVSSVQRVSLRDVTATVGSTACFSAVVTASVPLAALAFAWTKNGLALQGGSATRCFSVVATFGERSTIAVTVAHAWGSAQATAQLTVECRPGWYDSAAGAGLACSACHSSCGTCSAPGPSSCTGCSPTATLLGGVCSCAAGQYSTGSNGAVTCAPCSPKCAQCSGGGSSACTACRPSASLVGGRCVFTVRECGACIVSDVTDEEVRYLRADVVVHHLLLSAGRSLVCEGSCVCLLISVSQ